MKIVITGVGGLIRKYLIEELSCLNFYIIEIKKSLDSGKLLLDNRSKSKFFFDREPKFPLSKATDEMFYE
tara:strand:- start:322 stop:531 length:210 start_codon:yes stop_codon:yes gene_type:complete